MVKMEVLKSWNILVMNIGYQAIRKMREGK